MCVKAVSEGEASKRLWVVSCTQQHLCITWMKRNQKTDRKILSLNSSAFPLIQMCFVILGSLVKQFTCQTVLRNRNLWRGMWWVELYPPAKIWWSPNRTQSVTRFGDRVFTKVITLNEVSRLAPNPICLVSLSKGETRTQTQGEDDMR